MARPRTNLDVRMKRFGRDLALSFSGPAGLWEDGDLARGGKFRRRDLAVASEVDAVEQMLVGRLETRKGELAPLGHPEYGSRHHDLIGEPNLERTRRLIKLHVLEALSHEPRLEAVLSCTVFPAHDPPRSQVRIVMDLQLIDEDSPRNLVVPFSLEPAS